MAVIHYKILDLNLIIMPKLYLEKLHNLVHIDWKYLLQCRYQINHTIVRWVEITIQRVCLASRKRKFSTWHEKFVSTQVQQRGVKIINSKSNVWLEEKGDDWRG